MEFEILAADAPDWFDISVMGEIYRVQPNRGIVIGPDGMEYDAEFWHEEWGISQSDVIDAYINDLNV